jgi:hypothetical protein
MIARSTTVAGTGPKYVMSDEVIRSVVWATTSAQML